MIKLRMGGAAMALGGMLLVGRIGPVIARKPADIAFPPETTSDLVRLAEAVGPLWPLAHLLGLVALFLLAAGYWAHAEALAKHGRPATGRAAAIIATAGFGLFALAQITDGAIVYGAALKSAAAPGDAALIEAVGQAHDRALFFYTPAVFVMFVAIGVLASRMNHGLLHVRWLGWLGQAIAVIALTLFMTGLAGPNWSNMQTGGLAFMAGVFWQVLVGLFALFGPGVRARGAAAPASA